MYVFCERYVVDAAIRTVANLNPPADATHVEIQADTQNVRYTMDNVTNPLANLMGMIFVANAIPKTFLIDDLRRIRFTRIGINAALNLHYFRG